jgi:hypothetical protein
MLKENILKIRGINDKLVAITGGVKSTSKKVHVGTLTGAIRGLMTDFEPFNKLDETNWDIKRRNAFNEQGIRIKQKNQDKLEKADAIELTKVEKVIISNIRKFQLAGNVIDKNTKWYDIKMANKPSISDERKVLNKEIRSISTENVQKMLDLYRAYQIAKSKFDDLVKSVNAQKKQSKKAK